MSDIDKELDNIPLPSAPPLDLDAEAAASLQEALVQPPQVDIPAAAAPAEETPVPAEQSTASNEQGDSAPITYFELPAPIDSDTVEMEQPILLKSKKAFNDEYETLVLPTDTAERTSAYTRSLPNVDYNDINSTEWLAAIQEGNENTAVRGGFFRKRLAKRGARFRQAVRNEKNQPLIASAPHIGSEGLSTLSGTHALVRMRAQLNMGHVLYVPLWHSGFWIAMRAPTDAALVNLFTRIESAKIRFGRSTYGIAFGNSSVFYAQEIFNFAIAHMLECTLKDPTPARLEQFIKQPDINSIANALAALIWPNGFQYVRPIFDAGGKERNLIKDLIDIRKTMWVDTSVLTKRQTQMMTNRTIGSVTDEMIKSYQDEFAGSTIAAIRLSEERKMWIHCRIPSMKDYFNSGQDWVNGIIAMTEEAFSQDISDDARNQRISLQAQASNMRQYSHWIDAVTISDDPTDERETVRKQETVDELLGGVADDEEIRDNFFKKVREFIDEVTFVICAVPAFDKEEIEKTQTSSRFPILVPIDPMATFFTLLVQKIRRISQRP